MFFTLLFLKESIKKFYAFKKVVKEHLDNQQGRIISRQNLNEY